MMKISLRYKIALELYASLSFFTVILFSIYSIIYKMFGEDITIPAAVLGFFLITFINTLKNLIIDVNSVKFVDDQSRDEPDVVEMLIFDKVLLEVIAGVSNILIIASFFIFGVSRSGKADVELVSKGFIVVLCIPLLILLKSLLLDFNIIFMNKKRRENFFYQLINRKTLAFVVMAAIIIFLIVGSSKMVTSTGRLYQKPMSAGESAINEAASNFYVTSIVGERSNLTEGNIALLNIYIEAMDLDFNLNSINIKFIDGDTESNLKYGITANGSHYYFEGRRTPKGSPILKKEDKGMIRINLSATDQELHSGDRGIVQLIMSNRRVIYREFMVPEFKSEQKIFLYPVP